jgi:hypothetical protein
VSKSTGYTIYHRHNHDVPLAARQKWALTLERMKRNAESRGMIATLEFIELDNTTNSHLSVVSEKGEARKEIPHCPCCVDIREIAEMYERYRNTEKCKSR